MTGSRFHFTSGEDVVLNTDGTRRLGDPWTGDPRLDSLPSLQSTCTPHSDLSVRHLCDPRSDTRGGVSSEAVVGTPFRDESDPSTHHPTRSPVGVEDQ